MDNRINVTRSSMPPFEEYMEEIRPLWESRWLTNSGVLHQRLAAQLKERMNVPELLLFCNGHMALEAAFSQFEKGSEVITTPFTYVSTTLAIIRSGLVPVFCDIEPRFYTMDPDKIEVLITDKTVAIAPVHVYGNMCDCRRIEEIAHRNGLKVIYDAAHAFGVTYQGVDAGAWGDMSMLSFHATKVFNTIEGGCLCVKDAELAAKLRAWKHFGVYHDDVLELEGTNAKLTEFASAMGLCNLRHLSDEIMLRRTAAEQYRRRLSGVPGLVLCPMQPDVEPNYAYMPVRIVDRDFGRDREDVLAALRCNNIFARRYFYPLTSDTPFCRDNFAIHQTPVASEVSSQILCLPLYADLAEETVDRICDVILSCRESK